MSRNSFYKTKDLYEAAALHASGQKLKNLEANSNFYWFLFGNRTVCEKIAASYWAEELLVNAKKYADALRTLKDRIFAQKK